MFSFLNQSLQSLFLRYFSQFLIVAIGLFLLFSQCGFLLNSPHVASAVDCPSTHAAHHEATPTQADLLLIEHHLAPFGALGMITYFALLFVVTALAAFVVILDRRQFWISDNEAFSSWLPPPLLFGFVGARSFQPSYLPRSGMA